MPLNPIPGGKLITDPAWSVSGTLALTLTWMSSRGAVSLTQSILRRQRVGSGNTSRRACSCSASCSKLLVLAAAAPWYHSKGTRESTMIKTWGESQREWKIFSWKRYFIFSKLWTNASFVSKIMQQLKKTLQLQGLHFYGDHQRPRSYF